MGEDPARQGSEGGGLSVDAGFFRRPPDSADRGPSQCLRVLAGDTARDYLQPLWHIEWEIQTVSVEPTNTISFADIAGMEGLLPETVALPVLTYLAAASLWPWLLRRWLDS